ncbi:hypothetical protein EMCRGX_G019120 [Ephydatia muelleri]
MSHCLRQVSTLSRTPLQRSYDTLALTSLRANMTVIGLMAAPKIHLKSVLSLAVFSHQGICRLKSLP